MLIKRLALYILSISVPHVIMSSISPTAVRRIFPADREPPRTMSISRVALPSQLRGPDNPISVQSTFNTHFISRNSDVDINSIARK